MGFFEFIVYCFKCLIAGFAATYGHQPDWFGVKDALIAGATFGAIIFIIIVVNLIIILIRKKKNNKK